MKYNYNIQLFYNKIIDDMIELHTAIFYYDAVLLAKAAGILGKTEEAKGLDLIC